jgi:hypothetical protein
MSDQDNGLRFSVSSVEGGDSVEAFLQKFRLFFERPSEESRVVVV